MSNSRDYEAGRYNRPPRPGGDWNAYRQGQADQQRWADNAKQHSEAVKKLGQGSAAPDPGFPTGRGGDSGGGGISGLIALPALLLGIVLAPVAAVIAAVATPVLVALGRRRGEDLRHRDMLWPAAVTAFVIVAINAALAFLQRDEIGRSPFGPILVMEVVAVLAAGFVLQRMGTHDSYLRAVTDAALAFIAPVVLCIALVAFSNRIGGFYADIPLILWLPALGLVAAMISALTGMVYGALARWVFRQPFREAFVTGMLGAFVSIIVTGLIFYFFQPGEPFVRAVLTRARDGGSVPGGLAGFVLLLIPGVVLCGAVTVWRNAAAAPRRARLLAGGAVLAVVSNLWALHALANSYGLRALAASVAEW